MNNENMTKSPKEYHYYEGVRSNRRDYGTDVPNIHNLRDFICHLKESSKKHRFNVYVLGSESDSVALNMSKVGVRSVTRAKMLLTDYMECGNEMLRNFTRDYVKSEARTGQKLTTTFFINLL